MSSSLRDLKRGRKILTNHDLAAQSLLRKPSGLNVPTQVFLEQSLAIVSLYNLLVSVGEVRRGEHHARTG